MRPSLEVHLSAGRASNHFCIATEDGAVTYVRLSGEVSHVQLDRALAAANPPVQIESKSRRLERTVILGAFDGIAHQDATEQTISVESRSVVRDERRDRRFLLSGLAVAFSAATVAIVNLLHAGLIP